MLEHTFGEVLRDLRNQRKISQERLAEYADLDRTYISLLERGLRQPTLETIFKISNALTILPSELIKRVEKIHFHLNE